MKKRFTVWFFILAVVFFSLSSTAQGEKNLLINPGFENVDPAGWATYGDFAYDVETHRTGNQSGKAWAWNYGDGLFEQFVDVIPGKKYKASVYILSKSNDTIRNGTKTWIQIEYYTKDNIIISDPIKSRSLTKANDKWEFFSTPAIVAPSGAAKAKVKIIQRAPETNIAGSCYFDDAGFSFVPLL